MLSELAACPSGSVIGSIRIMPDRAATCPPTSRPRSRSACPGLAGIVRGDATFAGIPRVAATLGECGRALGAGLAPRRPPGAIGGRPARAGGAALGAAAAQSATAQTGGGRRNQIREQRSPRRFASKRRGRRSGRDRHDRSDAEQRQQRDQQHFDVRARHRETPLAKWYERHHTASRRARRRGSASRAAIKFSAGAPPVTPAFLVPQPAARRRSRCS